ncbi:MAG: class I SAM-dependent methyltransferase [Nannocystaceae bacterium]
MQTAREFWNGPGGTKWVGAQPLMDAVLAPFAEVLLEAAQLPERGVLVDVGCGCGATTLMAAGRRPGIEVIGVDISEAMVTRARGRADEAELRVRFDVADAASARPAPRVDRVISRFGVMFFDEPARAFENMRGWLASEGMLVALVWGPVADNPWTADLLEVLREHVDVPTPSEEGPGPFGLSDPDRVQGLLHGAGFEQVEQRPLDLPMRVPGSLDDALRFHWERSLVERALADADEATRQAVRERLRAYVSERHDGTAIELGAQARLVRARS